MQSDFTLHPHTVYKHWMLDCLLSTASCVRNRAWSQGMVLRICLPLTRTCLFFLCVGIDTFQAHYDAKIVGLQRFAHTRASKRAPRTCQCVFTVQLVLSDTAAFPGTFYVHETLIPVWLIAVAYRKYTTGKLLIVLFRRSCKPEPLSPLESSTY